MPSPAEFDRPVRELAPARSPLEVASGPTPKSLAPLGASDPLLSEMGEKRLRARIASFSGDAIYIPAASPPVAGALVRLTLRDHTAAAGEVVWSRRAMPLAGAAVRFVTAGGSGAGTARSDDAPVDGDAADIENAWEALVASPRVPELPPAAAAVLRAAASSRTGARELAQEVSRDERLSEAVIALANSADFRAPERMTDVRSAVVRLGLQRVRSLVLASSVFRLFPAGGPPEGAAGGPEAGAAPIDPRVSSSGLWVHSITAAFSAEAVALLVGIPVEDAFLAGLFHDLGKLLLVRLLPGAYAVALDRVEEQGITLAEGERAVLGFTHARAGAWLLSRWGLPGSVVAAVAGHHGGPSSALAAASRAGDLIARALAAGSTCDRRMPAPDASALSSIGIGPEDCAHAVGFAAARTALGAGAFEQAGVRSPFLPRTAEATEADPILREAAEAAAARRREDLFGGLGSKKAGARDASDGDAYLAALLLGAEALAG